MAPLNDFDWAFIEHERANDPDRTRSAVDLTTDITLASDTVAQGSRPHAQDGLPGLCDPFPFAEFEHFLNQGAQIRSRLQSIKTESRIADLRRSRSHR